MTPEAVDDSAMKGGARVEPPLLLSPFRLPGNAYEAVFEQGRSLAGSAMVMRWRANGLSKSRVGVVAAKRTLRLAVERSRARRLMREAFRLERPALAAGVDVVLIARRKLVEGDCAAARRELRWLWRKAGLMGRAERAGEARG